MENTRERRPSGGDEVAIEPELPVCDAHHHLWLRNGDYLIDEFVEDTKEHNVVASVFVACEAMYRTSGPVELRPVGETEFVESLANSPAARNARTQVAAGIVCFADLMLGAAVREVLEAHLSASPTRLRGVRHTVTWDASPEVRTSAPYPGPRQMFDARFREGFGCLRELNLTFDAWLFHPQLPDLVALARAYPDTTIVLNHTGMPLGIGPYAGRRSEVFAAWKRDITELARCGNVFVKLGGLGNPRAGFGWDKATARPNSIELAEATAPYYLTCIEAFGCDRCMFESNFPVDKVSHSYTVLWNSFKRMTSGFSAAERAALFYGSAARAYRLPADHRSAAQTGASGPAIQRAV